MPMPSCCTATATQNKLDLALVCAEPGANNLENLSLCQIDLENKLAYFPMQSHRRIELKSVG
eukprot:scaffold4462_cov119-Skeletonema_dohrnii-CCMP3373.AAC.3